MLTEILERLMIKFGPQAMADQIALFLPKLIGALFTFIVFYTLWRLIKSLLMWGSTRFKLDKTLSEFALTVIRYAVLTLGVISALGELGINTASMLASLGVVGLTVGFAAKDTLSNLISGIFIFWDRPFVIGDLIEIDGLYGKVLEITMRSTRVVTPDGKMLAIPNSVVVNTTVASYTNFPHLRLDIPITIGVNEDIERVRGLFEGVIAGDEAYRPEPPPRVVLSSVNDYNLELTFQIWIEDETRHIAQRFALREQIFIALRDAGVDMPYETLQLVDPAAKGMTA
jgi:small conductance mechanosensitive channel